MHISSFQALSSKWSNVDASEDGFGLFGELDWNDYIWVVCINVIYTVDQCLIKIKYDCLSL